MVAIDAGVRMIGENRPQEVTAKAEGWHGDARNAGFRWASQASRRMLRRSIFHST